MSESFDRNTALAVCFSNLKGSKNKDLLLTARALEYLKELPEFGSNQRVAEQVGVSGEIVRQFISLLDLPDSVQKFFQDRELGLEQGTKTLATQPFKTVNNRSYSFGYGFDDRHGCPGLG